ncbi:hypothetical protein HUG10_20545 (plasmid) [Halorarum halophilum]|uniref:Histidine kinase-, DNA gyrase B-, and HSP90-like ATPase n=1 Tax=Halorarum halophilum TaxID=2743090 RepID=A0A7D5KYJ1_9EURY|nr:hypothetical protein [Halobaculum halophilum]QLG29998.1 hypothetical protein HUG10_20545 [Halobaculum halophilum]
MSKNETDASSDSGATEDALDGSMLDTIEPVETGLATDEEPEPEFQKARHEVGQKNLQATGSEHPLAIASGSTASIEQRVDNEVVLDYLSDKIYGGPDSTIREYLANAETACIRAAEVLLKDEAGFDEDDFWVVDDEHPDYHPDKREHRQPVRRLFPKEILDAAQAHCGYEPTIEVEWHEGDNLLVIAENGVGFTPREVTDVLAVTGHSGVRDRGDVSGQFGMGVMSAHKVVGKEGAYTLITRTRRTDIPDWAQESFAAYCYLGGYDMIEGSLPDGSYGTRFELPIKENLDDNHGSRYDDTPVITKWVGKYAEYMRVPVLYHHFNDGDTVHDDEFGDKEFADDYNGAVLTIDRPEFIAKSYPSASNDTLLLSMPIKRNYRYSPPDAPWSVDIRLRNEGGIVIEGPNRGLMPVEDAEYENMEDDRREKFVRKSDLEDEDITLPEPTASRDELQKNEPFWKWIGGEFDQLYKDEIKRFVASVSDLDDLEDLASDDPNGFSFLMVGLSKFKSYKVSDGADFQDVIEEKLETTLDEEFCDQLLLLMTNVELAPRGRSGVRLKNNRTKEKTWRIFRDAADGDVYMGVNINEKRTKVVWATHDANQVARVSKSGKYKEYEQLGWKRLADVPYSSGAENASQFTIPSDLKSSGSAGGKSNAGKDAADRQLTVRRSSDRGDCENHTASSIKDSLELYDQGKGDGVKVSWNKHVHEIVLFPSSTDRRMTDWYDVIKPHKGRGCATCINGVYEYLKDVPGIMHIDDLIADSDDVTLTTSEGDMTVSDAGDELLVHLVNADYLDRFREPEIMTRLAELLHDELEEHCDDFSWDYEEEMYPDKFIYAPVDKNAWRRIQPGSFESDYVVIAGDLRVTNVGATHTHGYQSDAELYAMGRFYNWDADSPEITSLKSLVTSRDPEQAFALIDTLAMLHDNGVKPSSAQNGQIVKLTVEQQASLDDTSDSDATSDGGTDTPEHEALADGGEE